MNKPKLQPRLEFWFNELYMRLVLLLAIQMLWGSHGFRLIVL